MTTGPVSASALLQIRSTVLAQNAELRRAAGADAAGGSDFGAALTEAVKAVSQQQAQASDAAAAYERGDTNDLVGVMLARQKASIGFEATMQVRNKLLGAYRDIMNMPV